TGSAGKPGNEQVYSYDDSGRLVGISSGISGGRESKHNIKFEYDAGGRKKKIETYPTRNPQETWSFAWEDSEAPFSVPSGGSVTTIYNEHDQPTEAQIRDSDGRLVSRLIRTYDANGRVLNDKLATENAEP